MIDPATGIDTLRIRWLHNRVWHPLPHRYFLTNNINQEFRKQGKDVRNTEQKKISEQLQSGKEITINHILFKVESTTVTL
jgi:hypothetical protein